MTESFLLNTYPDPKAKFVSGKGSTLVDDKGNEYLDFLSGIAVVSLGHSNNEIAEIISVQSKKLSHVSNYFANEYTQKVASKIDEKISLSTANHGKVFFANSGAEANECAIKVAKKYGNHKRYKILTALGSFHGRTLATLAATGQPEKQANFLPLPDFFNHFEFGNARSLQDQLDDETVAVMIEVIQGENGVRIADQNFFDDLKKTCKDNDLLLIVDEVQTGLCRTGKWFGFEHYGLDPDVVTMAKALGNGFPVSACWTKESVASAMEVGDHGSTFGSQPLALSVVNGVFEIMEREKLDQRAAELGEKLKSALQNTGLFSEVRGEGLLIGADLVDAKASAQEFCDSAFNLGLIINATGPRTIRLAPPLIINEQDIENAVEIITKAAV